MLLMERSGASGRAASELLTALSVLTRGTAVVTATSPNKSRLKGSEDAGSPALFISINTPLVCLKPEHLGEKHQLCVCSQLHLRSLTHTAAWGLQLQVLHSFQERRLDGFQYVCKYLHHKHLE